MKIVLLRVSILRLGINFSSLISFSIDILLDRNVLKLKEDGKNNCIYNLKYNRLLLLLLLS